MSIPHGQFSDTRKLREKQLMVSWYALARKCLYICTCLPADHNVHFDKASNWVVRYKKACFNMDRSLVNSKTVFSFMALYVICNTL